MWPQVLTLSTLFDTHGPGRQEGCDLGGDERVEIERAVGVPLKLMLVEQREEHGTDKRERRQARIERLGELAGVDVAREPAREDVDGRVEQAGQERGPCLRDAEPGEQPCAQEVSHTHGAPCVDEQAKGGVEGLGQGAEFGVEHGDVSARAGLVQGRGDRALDAAEVVAQRGARDPAVLGHGVEGGASVMGGAKEREHEAGESRTFWGVLRHECLMA